MNGVGTDIGYTHKQRQGTGLATILPDDHFAARSYIAGQAARGEQLRQAAAAQDEARRKMLEFNPDRWFKHEMQIRGKMNEWVDKGSALLAKNINPSTGLDEESRQWRNEKARIEALANQSQQMQKMFEATRGKIDGSEADKYDPEAIGNMYNYFNADLEKVVDGGILPPPLLQRKPGLNLQTEWVGRMKDLGDRTGKGELKEGERWEFIRESVGARPELTESASSYLMNLPQAAQDEYRNRSEQSGKSPLELVHYDFLTRYEKKPEPIDLNKYIQSGADSIDVPYASWQNPDKFGTAVDSKEMKRIADNKATLMLANNPEALYAYRSLLPMKDNESEGVYRARAIGDLSKRLNQLKATQTKSGITAQGQDKKDIQESGQRWLQDMRSGDSDRHMEAAGYLFQTPGIMGGYNVETALVQDMGDKGRYLVLTLAGDPQLKEVKEKMVDEMGRPTEFSKFMTENTEGNLVVPLNNESENALLKLHDRSFNTTKNAYRGKISTWRADDLIKPQSQAKF